MSSKYLILLLSLLASCTKHTTKMQEQIVIQEQESSHTYDDPCLFLGTSYPLFLRQLYLQGDYPGLIDQVCKEDKESYTNDQLKEMIDQLDLAVEMRLKSSEKINDTMYLMNYKSAVMGTNRVKRFKVVIESDSCKLALVETISLINDVTVY